MADPDSRNQPEAPSSNAKPSRISRGIDSAQRHLQKRRAQKLQEGAADRAARSTARAIWFIAVLTVAAIVVGISQYVIFDKQLAVMQGQLDQMAADERPWLKLASANPVALDVRNGLVVIDLNLQIKNIGKLPAEDVAVTARIFPKLSITEEHNAATAVCRNATSRSKSDLSEIIFPDEQRRADEYAFPIPVATIRTAQQERIGNDSDPKTVAAYPVFGTFTLVGCITYSFSKGSFGQTAFMLDIDRPCPESPVGKCAFDVSHHETYRSDAMLTSEVRRGLFAR